MPAPVRVFGELRGAPEQGSPRRGWDDGMNRRILTLVLFVLLGAAVNIAVAWGQPWICQWVYRVWPERITETDGYSRDGEDFRSWYVKRTTAVGFDRVLSQWCPGQDMYHMPPSTPPAEDVLPAWAAPARPGGEFPERDIVFRLLDARGWPMLALRSNLDWSFSGQSGPSVLTLGQVVTVSSGYLLAHDRRRSALDIEWAQVVPLAPIWPGFLVNSLFYAALLWLVISGPFILRRFLRFKRGHCPPCGYDLRGAFHAGCPECWWGREEELGAPA